MTFKLDSLMCNSATYFTVHTKKKKKELRETEQIFNAPGSI